MFVFADCPQRASDLLPVTNWRPLERLEGIDTSLWEALDGGDAAWVGEIAESVYGRVAIVANAPRSQLDALHEAIGAGLPLPEPAVAVALTGRGFRGQRGRDWATKPGNLFLVIALPVAAPVQAALPGLVALPAVALADALLELGAPVGIKWVNDILANGAKLAGVLAMSHTRGDILETAVLGIGVNVAHAPVVPPTPFVPTVTSLSALGIAADLGRVLRAVLDAVARRWSLVGNDPGALVNAYRQHSCVLEQRVAIWPEGDNRAQGEPLATGVVDAINDDLSLRLVGRAEPIHAGRLELLGDGKS